MPNIISIYAIEQYTMNMNAHKKKMKIFGGVRDFYEKYNKMITFVVFVIFLIPISLSFISLPFEGSLALAGWMIFSVIAAAAFALMSYIFGFLFFIMYMGERFDSSREDFTKSFNAQFGFIEIAIDNDVFYQAFLSDNDIIYSFEKLSELALAHPRKD